MSQDEQALTTRLELITKRLIDLEVQVRALVESPIVETEGFVVKEDRGGMSLIGEGV